MRTPPIRRHALRLALAALLGTFAVATGASPAAAAVTPVPGDPLTGSGAVSRTLLTKAELTGGTATSTIADSAFALPAAAAMPLHTFSGRLELTGEATGGGFTELEDDFAYTNAGDSPRKHLPEISLEFVQNGSHLIPVEQGLRITGNAVWNLLVSPGRAWSETGDGGWSRASVPFALVQRNANCVHNATMTFLFNATSVSQVRYQVTQETCLYFKFDLWGQLPATYTPYPVAGAEAVRNAHAAEVAGRLPTKPIAALAADHPSAGLDLAAFGSGVTPAHMSAYGLLHDGVNYVSGCSTRQGTYPFCEVMRLPSYSTAKSAMAGTALMRLTQTHGTGVSGQLIRDWVPEHASATGRWAGVTINHTLDMATGNYRFATYMTDEGGAIVSDFLSAEPYATKIDLAFDFPSRVAPGTKWVYHTTGTFIATRAMRNYLGSDLFDELRDGVYVPAKLSRGALTSLRTGNSATGQAFGGYGLFYNRDDIAKLAKLYNNDGGVAGGVQVLHPGLLGATMQKDPADRGIATTSAAGFRYNNGFWAKQLTPAEFPQYDCSFWVPFMSGYGGITVAMLPNGATYYYFSDNDEFSWYAAVHEAGKLAPYC
ncbi:beta-lactamase family protein [Nonomuraea turkmeniaca]|uniref:Beta-lactamase family protein n=1 Tax=Nonomuraea turkmeniaca TaxID=103838 RepID=A0A5S4FH81_9ACTN|nr:serine hydrolase [Nonomuraea turkmeniaca]TMR19303.1 beta-lactamase family protein [Nonomuraea turkmeniaca]